MDKKIGKELAIELEKYFFLPVPENELLAEIIDLSNNLDSNYSDTAETFIHNIKSMISVVSMPVVLGSSAIQDKHFTRFHMAERIRSLKTDFKIDETVSEEPHEVARDKTANQIANEKFSKFVETKEGKSNLAIDTCEFLLKTVSNSELINASNILQQQGIVLLWGAFEILAKDAFIIYVDKNPISIKSLQENPSTKNRFELQKFTSEILIEHEFDLSNNMGKVIGRNQDFSDIVTIKETYDTLFPDSVSERNILREKDLWNLSQKRHLIVHRRGIVDQKFLNKTGLELNVGDEINISPEKLYSYVKQTIQCGIAILKSFV